jgi:hypothetical protein
VDHMIRKIHNWRSVGMNCIVLGQFEVHGAL